MDSKERKLLDLKKKIEDAKQRLAELQGQEQLLLKQLREDWNCSNIGQAEAKIEDIESDISSLEKEIEEALNDIRKKYDI